MKGKGNSAESKGTTGAKIAAIFPVHPFLYHSIRHTRWGAALASLVVALAFSAVPLFFVADYQEGRRQQLAQEAKLHLTGRMTHIEAALQRAKSFPGIAALAISQSDSLVRFEKVY